MLFQLGIWRFRFVEYKSAFVFRKFNMATKYFVLLDLFETMYSGIFGMADPI